MSGSRSLDEVLADWAENATVLRRTGHVHDARLIEQMTDEVRSAAEDWLAWLPEADAMLRSGRSTDWLRRRFPQWEAAGHAMRRGRVRYYRAAIIPQRPNLEAAYEEGRRAAS